MTRKGSTESFFLFHFIAYSPSWREVRTGTQDGSLDTKAEERPRSSDVNWLALHSLPGFFILFGGTCPGGGTPMEDWALPYQENVPAGLHPGQADRAIFTIGLLSSQTTQTSVKLTKISQHHVYFLTNSYFFKTKFSSLAVRWHLDFSLL